MNIATATGRRLGWRGVLALLLVPLLVAGSFLAGVGPFERNVRSVEAAVVNNDEAVEINGQTVPLGRQLSAALVDSNREQNFTWVLADSSNAAEGLASGRFAAVVTIPEDFSAAATSYSDTTDVRQATIAIQTSPSAGLVETSLGQAVAAAAVQTLNGDLTRGYLENVYLGFNTMGEQFVTVADGAGQLADGAAQLSDGLGQASTGAGQLADGLGQAASGGQQLSAGGAQLATGTQQLATGLGTMADQTKDMPSQIQQLADGTATLATGVSAYSDGVDQYVTGINSIVTPVREVVAQLPDLTELMDRIDTIMADLPSRAVALDDAVQKAIAAIRELLDSIGGLNRSAATLSGDLDGYAAAVQKVASGATQLACPDDLADVEGGCAAFAAGVRAGGGAAQQRLADVDAGPVVAAASSVASSADQLDQALDQIAAASSWLRQNAGEIQTQWQSIRTTIPAGTSPNDYLLTQLDTLIDGGNQLMSGGHELATGTATLSDGVAQLSAGVPALVDGIQQSADGARQLSDGVGAYTGGVSQLVDGLGSAHSGAADLASGMTQLADGSTGLADGSRKLADGLAEGADSIPSYTEAERTQLASVVAAPVSGADLEGLVTPTESWISLLLVLALGLGALATYALIKPVDPRNAASSAPTSHLIVRTLLPGAAIVAAQAVLLTALGAVALGLSPGQTAGLAGVLLVAGLALTAISHALAAWAGVWGRLFYGALLLVTTITAVTASAPSLFDSLRPVSPLSPALDAVRSVITGQTTALAVVALAGWGVLGLGLGVLKIIRSRTVTVRQLATESGPSAG